MEYGLIGERLAHSYSPQIHAQLADYRYELKALPPDALDSFLAARGFRGLNVTIPYKQAVIPHCAELTDEAKDIGSVNTLIKRSDDSLIGHNTDIGGFIYMLSQAGIDPLNRKAVILGSGGTSLTAQTALRRMGAREIVVISRSGPVTYDDLYARHADAEILVNTTPVGMYPKAGISPVDLDQLPQIAGVVDVIYNPEKTKLILDALAKGIDCVSGLPMLVAQAHEAAQWFTGNAISPDAIEDIVGNIKGQMLNLILIGMPGCGKSSLGALLAQTMNRPLIDCDAEIVQRAGMPIPEIFEKYGEARFRDIETDVIRDVCSGSGAVIATGGGAILRPGNVDAMRQNGRICFIRRSIDLLPRSGRPLSSASGDAVVRLWETRRDLYHAAADYIAENDGALETAAENIREGFYEAARH